MKYGGEDLLKSNQENESIHRSILRMEWGGWCPHHVTEEYIPPEENSLDYVFEHVESFACKGGDDDDDDGVVDPYNTVAAGQYPSASPLVARDNSLVESYKGGLTHKFAPQLNNSSRAAVNKAPLGTKGDLLDYRSSKNVESFTCGDAATGNLEDEVLQQKQRRGVSFPTPSFLRDHKVWPNWTITNQKIISIVSQTHQTSRILKTVMMREKESVSSSLTEKVDLNCKWKWRRGK